MKIGVKGTIIRKYVKVNNDVVKFSYLIKIKEITKQSEDIESILKLGILKFRENIDDINSDTDSTYFILNKNIELFLYLSNLPINLEIDDEIEIYLANTNSTLNVEKIVWE